MSKPIRIGIGGVLAADANGNLIGGRTTNVKGLTPALIGKELGELTGRAESRGHFTPAELKRYEELVAEGARKQNIAKLAKEADMRKIGAKIRGEANQRRLDAQSPRAKDIVSRANSGDQVDRSDAIKARHARLKRKP